MIKYSLRFLTLTLIGILIYSCQNDDFFDDNQGNKNEISTFNDIVLGKKTRKSLLCFKYEKGFE